jgi:glycosyltransferase involved in cell wall biosynthesis
VIGQLASRNPAVRAVKFRRNYGKSAAIHVGFHRAVGEVVITMDADLQDSPDEIPELYQMMKQGGYDLISGWKRQRFDPKLTKNLPSKLYNWTARKVTGIVLHDFNCGLKAYRNELCHSIEVYGEMHRYIPVIAHHAGFRKIGEKVVMHQKRKYGTSKFGLERFVNGMLDLLSISFITRFSKKPMHFFGTMGILVSLSGLAVVVWLIAEKLVKLYQHLPLREVTEQPLFYLALTFMSIGVQLFLAGFVAELVSRSSADRNDYLIEQTL